MKKLLNILAIVGIVLGSTLGGAYAVDASICIVQQGCTSVSTISGIIQGNGTSPFTGIALPADATKYLDGTGNFSTPGGGSGTVTTLSVVSTNGFAGTVANATTTPAITLSTSITGLLKGNGTAISSASAGTDYLLPSGSGSALTGIPLTVANSDSTLTISPTTGSVIASLNLAHANTWTGSQTISTAPLIISGNQSASAWTTTGTGLVIAPASFTDTSSSGAVSVMGINAIGTPTLLASSATTYTSAATLYIASAPAASTNVTVSTGYSLYIASGKALFAGGLQTSSVPSNANIASGGSTGTVTTNTSTVLFAGASSVGYRAIMNGSTSSSLSSNNSYANLIIGSAPISVPSGTAALLASLVINPVGTITNSGTITNTATLYVNGPASGGTNNYSLWDVGQSRFDLGSDATGDTFYRASTGVFTRLGIGATGTRLTVVGGIPSWVAPTGVSNYTHTIFTPTTGQTITLINNQYNIVNPAGALLALTINLPSTPSNNDVVYIKFTQNVTTVTYANGTVVDGITAPTAGGLTVLTYDSGTTSWY